MTFSFLTRSKPSPPPPQYELSQVINLEPLMSFMDSRNSLSHILDNDDISESSNSSTSSIHRTSNYQKEEEEEEDSTPFLSRDIEEEANDVIGKKTKTTTCNKWICMAFLLLIFTFWLIWTIGLSQMGPVTEAEEQSSVKKHIDLPDLYNISFATRRPSLEWVKHDLRDGVFSYRSPTTNDIILQSIEGGVAGILVNATDLSINEGQLEVEGFEISQDAQYILFKTNVTKLWRYSSYANMYVYHVSNKTLFPLHPLATVNNTPMVSYAVWSPQGHQLAYVLGNDLFVTDLQNTTRITFDGSSTIFNGVPDWVYEEEVFSKNYAVWWSPDATHLAYLRFNETAVPEYHMQYYTASNNSYPDETSIRYPKAGSPNPLVSLHVHSLPTNTTFMITHSDVLNTTQGFPETDRLITDVVWATETHTHLLFKQTNRIQDTELTHLVSLSPNLTQSSIQLARTYKPNDGGWVDLAQTMVFIPNKKANDSVVRYLDVIDDGEGFMHLAILRATDTKPRSPHWLTSGKWEVVSGSVVVDKTRQLVHYISTEKSHLERHLYSIQLNHSKPIRTKLCLTCADDEEVHAYYDASFSPQYGYYVLQYEGPDIPTTVVKKIDNSSFELVLQDNQPLRDVLSEYELPRTRMVSVKSGGIDMDAMEVLPPDFDATKKYPVLFHVYGGPGSQLASYQFELSWSTFLASKLGYIIVTVDGRGTGFKGRKYRSGVRERLGELETIDQINAARHWASLEYVDPSRIAIWGWSYGGYMASKVIEANSGLYAAGMAVAPVTDWRFYDSVYTERYMSTPELNPEGYIQSAVNNMTGFENTRYLLVHGTGDDNVHFQNAAVLVDKLTQANVHNYQVQFYTDNSHPIQYHNANQNVYYLLTNFLWESFGGEEYQHVRQELNGHFSGPISSH